MNRYKCSKCSLGFSRKHGIEAGACPRCDGEPVEVLPLTPAQMEQRIDDLRSEMIFDDGWDSCLIGDEGQSHIMKALAYLELAKIECQLARLAASRTAPTN